MLQLYFIRHGQSTNNVILDAVDFDDYLQERQTDPVLTTTGEEQVSLTADYLARPNNTEEFDPQNRKGYGLTHLYCSLMIRAVKTGQAIAKATGLPLIARPEVHETGGIFSIEMVGGERVLKGEPGPGRSYFQREFPDLILPESVSDNGWWNREKEPQAHYSIRARTIVDNLLADHRGQNHRVGVVTHGGIFANILTALFNIQAENYWIMMNNCGISRFDINDEGRVTLAYLNKVDFLPTHLVT